MSQAELYKVLYVLISGLEGVGKSTFVNTVSETVIYKSPNVSNRSEELDTDFGMIKLQDDQRICFLTVFQNTIAHVSKNLGGQTNVQWTHCILLNPSIAHISKSLQEIVKLIQTILRDKRPIIIAINRHKERESYSLAQMREIMNLPKTIPMLECDPVSDPASARRVLIELFKLLPEDDLVKAAIQKLGEGLE